MRSKEELELLFAKFDRDVQKRSRLNRFLLTLDQMGMPYFGTAVKMKQ